MTKRIIIIGDSHVDAIKKALKKYKINNSTISIEAYRYIKWKNDSCIGDLDEGQLRQILSQLSPNDFVVSAIGGNQHQVFSLVQHPVPFHVFTPSSSQEKLEENLIVISYNQVFDYFYQGIGGNDWRKLLSLKENCSCYVAHLVPPPPKKNVNHILNYHETHFKNNHLVEHGVSPAMMRLNIWKIQRDVLKKMAKESNIDLIYPPNESIDQYGFLTEECYANDATHGNERYGHLVLDEIFSCFDNYKL